MANYQQNERQAVSENDVREEFNGQLWRKGIKHDILFPHSAVFLIQETLAGLADIYEFLMCTASLVCSQIQPAIITNLGIDIKQLPCRLNFTL